MVWGLKIALQYLDPYREQREQAKRRAAFLKQHLGRTLDLNEFEQLLAAQVINPAHIDVQMQDVLGLEDIVSDLEIKVLYPLTRPEHYQTTLFKPVKGVLLYGPPGTGKTMLAKALAKQSNCFFLNITASAIMSKWLGDANRLVRAVFTLACKLQPCIIFIDEVDAMLGKRGASSEHEAMLQVKTEFMQLWDGMESGRGQRVVVMGATNRPWMVDEAVLRRFALMYEIGLPNVAQRKAILRGYLHKHQQEVELRDGRSSVVPDLLGDADANGTAAAVPSGGKAGGRSALDVIAEATESFSGSDLLELCSQGAQQVLAEHLHAIADAEREGRAPPHSMRPLELRDLQSALKHVQPSLTRADEYSRAIASRGAGAGGGGAGLPFGAVDLTAVMALLQQLRGG